MPINIGETVTGGAGHLCGSYLTNPLYTAILIVIIIAVILVWNYWQYCKVWSHLATLVYIFAATTIILIAHTEAISATYEDKYKNKAGAELIQSLTNQREHELMSNLIGARKSPIVPQPTMNGMHQGVPSAVQSLQQSQQPQSLQQSQQLPLAQSQLPQQQPQTAS